MLASRQEQENLIHEHQTAAAAKPLNQDVRGFPPKTPGNNSSKVKLPLKSAVKADENATILGKSAKHAFVTPIAPRERAPLGAKTTNAKSKAFQTPGPLTGGPGLPKTQRKSASGRKPKLKIHQPEAVEAEPIAQEGEEDNIPEVEYCPPKITELPDIPDFLPNAFEPDHEFPQFEGENMHRGWYTMYCNPIGEDGLSQIERERKQTRKELDEYAEEQMRLATEEQNAYFGLSAPERDIKQNSEPTSNSTNSSRASKPSLSTTKSRAAAMALSNRSQPSYAAPTAATKARGSAAPVSRQNNAATLASRSTIGYSKGRKVSATIREKKNVTPTSDQPTTFWENFEQSMKEHEELYKKLYGSDSDTHSDDGDGMVWKKRDLNDLFDDGREVFQFPKRED